MEPNLVSMPGYRNAEYLLVLTPHEDLRRRILNVKKEFHEAYRAPAAVGGKPHITLAIFKSIQMKEEKIASRLQLIAMATAPFKILLKDYGSFPSHTIFININTRIPVTNLVKEIRTLKTLLKSPEADPYFNTEPHLTIARKLNASQYASAWNEYAHKSFTGSFIADGMLLLKRYEGEKGYQIVRRFDFMNLPVSTKQGELFG